MATLHEELLAALDARHTVLATSRQAVHALKVAFGRRCVALGQGAWETPDILTAPAWAERTWRQHAGGSGGRLLSPQQVQVLWDRIVRDSPAANALMNPSSAARTAARSWALAQAWQIGIDEVAAAGGEEAVVFADWARRFERQCAEHGWVAPARLPWLLAQDDRAPAVHLHLARMAPLTSSERTLHTRITAAGGSVRSTGAGAPARSLQACAAPDAESELQRAANWARSRLEAGCGSVAIVVPDLESRRHPVRRLLEDTFAPGSRRLGESVEVPFSIGAAGTLDEFPIIRTALDLLQIVAGRVSGSLAGAVLRSPFLAGHAAEIGARARLDAALRRGSADHFDAPRLERLALAGQCPQLARQLAALRPSIPGPGVRMTVSRWAEQLLALLKTAGWPGDRIPTSEEQQTVARFTAALSEFGTLDDLLGPLSFPQVLAEFGQWVSGTTFEPQAPDAPVAVVDVESLPGLRADAVWVAGCEAGRWPQAPMPDPFLPLPLQIRAGLPRANATSCQVLAAREFAVLAGAGDEVVFSWALRDGDAEQGPSPLLAGLPPVTSPAPLRPRLREWMQARRPAPEQLVDSDAPPVAPGHVPGGSRIVELQSWCPFRAQAELRLAAEPLRQARVGIDARDRGTLLHRALEALWSELRSHAALVAQPPDVHAARARQLLERLSAPLFAGATPHRARLIDIEVDIAARRLAALLALERQRRPFSVLVRPEFAQRYAAHGLELDLAIDRIDVLEGGEPPHTEVIVDYKTGTSAHTARWWGPRPEQPQLPLYAVARRDHVAAVSFALLNARESQFRGVALEEDILPGVGPPAAGTQWNDMLTDWREVVDRLIGGFATGDARVDPLPGACSRCHLAGLCRVHEATAGPVAGEEE